MAEPTWGCYGCYSWGPELFHPDDRHLKEEMLRRGNVCESLGREGDYIVLRFGSLRVRLRADLTAFTPLPPPAFAFGELVRVKPHRTVRVGRVREIVIHHKRREYLFYLEGPGTVRKNRYFTHELEHADA